MKQTRLLILIMAFLLTISLSQVTADVIDDAFAACRAFKGTQMVSECDVRGGRSSIDIRVDTNGQEAQKICVQAAEVLAKRTSNFGGKWTLRVFSPFSGDHPLATCALK